MNTFINVTPLAHSSNEIKWINSDIFLGISCSGSNVSLHWYHKGSIVYPALTADPALTPYYPTAEGSHSGNIWLMLNAAKIYFDLNFKKKIRAVTSTDFCNRWTVPPNLNRIRLTERFASPYGALCFHVFTGSDSPPGTSRLQHAITYPASCLVAGFKSN